MNYFFNLCSRCAWCVYIIYLLIFLLVLLLIFHISLWSLNLRAAEFNCAAEGIKFDLRTADAVGFIYTGLMEKGVRVQLKMRTL